MRFKVLGLTVLAMLCAAAVVGTGAALAEKEACEVELEDVTPLDPNGEKWKYEGRVHSDSRKCRKGRHVKIVHKGFVIGTATTDKKGDFVIKSDALPPPGEKFSVIVEANERCEGDKATGTIDEFFEPPDD